MSDEAAVASLHELLDEREECKHEARFWGECGVNLRCHECDARAILASPALADLLRAERVRALREAADELAVDSSLTDSTRRPDCCSDARDDERVDNVLWLRDRAEREASS